MSSGSEAGDAPERPDQHRGEDPGNGDADRDEEDPDQNSDKKVVLVTGGGSGIGEATCRRLGAEGWNVGILDRDAAGAGRVADEVGGMALAADVADPAEVEAAVESLVGQFGHIDALVNNAGVGNLKRLEDYGPAEVDLIWRVNVVGTYNCLRACAPYLRESGGAVVNMASVSGIRPTQGEAPYSAAKAAVIALTRSAALEWAPLVRVNCVSPGFIRTPLNEMLAADPSTRRGIEQRTPSRRMGSVEDVTGVISFLLSPDSDYMTGENLAIDGGTLLSSAQMDPVLGALIDPGAPEAN